jgi:uncharacterized low-complexity protein
MRNKLIKAQNYSGHLALALAAAAAITLAASFSSKVTKEVKNIKEKFKLNEAKCDSEWKICTNMHSSQSQFET